MNIFIDLHLLVSVGIFPIISPFHLQICVLLYNIFYMIYIIYIFFFYRDIFYLLDLFGRWTRSGPKASPINGDYIILYLFIITPMNLQMRVILHNIRRLYSV